MLLERGKWLLARHGVLLGALASSPAATPTCCHPDPAPAQICPICGIDCHRHLTPCHCLGAESVTGGLYVFPMSHPSSSLLSVVDNKLNPQSRAYREIPEDAGVGITTDGGGCGGETIVQCRRPGPDPRVWEGLNPVILPLPPDNHNLYDVEVFREQFGPLPLKIPRLIPSSIPDYSWSG